MTDAPPKDPPKDPKISPADPPKQPDDIIIKIDDPKSATVADIAGLTKANLELQGKLDAANAEKDKIKKDTALDKLKIMNPKLAEINKDASVDTINTVLATLDNISSDFKKHNSDKVPEDNKPKDGAVGFKQLGSDKWLGIE